MQPVYIAECHKYDVKLIEQKLRQALSHWGGIETFVKPNATVLLKANLLMRRSPNEVTTTHPAVVQAVARLVAEAGARPIIGDSPGGPFTAKMLELIYRGTGMEQAARAGGAELNFNTEQVEVKNPSAKLLKQLTIIKAVQEADVIINLPKLKTHGMTTYTGAVKNLFGTVPGLLKVDYHMRMPNVEDFCDALVDIALTIKPALSVMDAIIGMEGNGPSAGDPVELGALLVSPDPFALDVVACHLAGIDTTQVPTITAAHRRGLCPLNAADIEILGCDPLQLRQSFRLPESTSVHMARPFLPGFLERALLERLRPRPEFAAEECVKCGVCLESCPPKALVMGQRKPEVDYKKCIRCFCCQELCPQKAVKIRRSLLSRLLTRW